MLDTGFEAKFEETLAPATSQHPPSVRYPSGVRPKGHAVFYFLIIPIIAGRRRAVPAQGGTQVAIDRSWTILVRHAPRPNAARCQARDNEQTDDYLHASSQASMWRCEVSV